MAHNLPRNARHKNEVPPYPKTARFTVAPEVVW